MVASNNIFQSRSPAVNAIQKLLQHHNLIAFLAKSRPTKQREIQPVIIANPENPPCQQDMSNLINTLEELRSQGIVTYEKTVTVGSAGQEFEGYIVNVHQVAELRKSVQPAPVCEPNAHTHQQIYASFYKPQQPAQAMTMDEEYNRTLGL